MKKKLVMTMLAGVMSLAICTACTDTTEVTTEEPAEATEEAVEEEPAEEVEEEPAEEEAEEEEAEDEGVDEEANLEAVQASLTYMGGLYVNGVDNCDMELAIFRNEEGNLVYLVYDEDTVYYGLDPECTDVEAEDGTAVTAFTLNDATFGYVFSEDMTEGVLVDANGGVYSALALDEEEARAMVTVTLMGDSYDTDAEVEPEEAAAEENAEGEKAAE